ncbi:MAG: hypothetical protein OHK93_001952 [Ramalina farinacea]|uniref:AB hydrolase-1 domain-containing protein n=1 Tax=Ramalina farinacea TaxID=258253 RepID=A0AA43QTT1_9LECA|nr:hypothetical protein [Ramalina farinacea]
MASLPADDPLINFSPDFPEDSIVNILKAYDFEKSKRAHALVDPFYTIPPHSARADPGSVLKVESETDTSLYNLPPNLSLSRFIYQSYDSKGRYVPVSAYVLWPDEAVPCNGGPPVVIWAHGTSGVFHESAPSNQKDLWHHFQLPFHLALNGYVVVATDYAGLGVREDSDGTFIPHEYLMPRAQAMDISTIIPAYRTAFPTINKSFVVVGTSQGGAAVWMFAEMLACKSYPTPGYLGTIALHPLLRLLDLPLRAPIMPLLMVMLGQSLEFHSQGFDEGFDASNIFTTHGKEVCKVYRTSGGGNAVLFQLPHPQSILQPGWERDAAIVRYQNWAQTGKRAFHGPMLVIQGEDDPIVPAEVTKRVVNETNLLGVGKPIQYVSLPGVSHAEAMYAGQMKCLQWISARFINAKLRSSFYTVQPLRQPASRQKETNWFISGQSFPWQQV